jgi:hypothetical protein
LTGQLSPYQHYSCHYSHHLDQGFSVLGQILDAPHLLECKGAEFESDIRMEMKRFIEDYAR